MEDFKREPASTTIPVSTSKLICSTKRSLRIQKSSYRILEGSWSENRDGRQLAPTFLQETNSLTENFSVVLEASFKGHAWDTGPEQVALAFRGRIVHVSQENGFHATHWELASHGRNQTAPRGAFHITFRLWVALGGNRDTCGSSTESPCAKHNNPATAFSCEEPTEITCFAAPCCFSQLPDEGTPTAEPKEEA